MSLTRFQAELGRLVTDPARRETIRSRGGVALPDDLTELERRRLVSAARSTGIAITGKLHKAFRLGKLLSTLPLTCALMGDELLSDELDLFWRSQAPRTFYYVLEALQFCDHVRARLRGGLVCRYLREVVEYEATGLRLRLATDEPGRTVDTPFEHDPEILLRRLAAREPPGSVARRPCLVRGTRDAKGNVAWSVIDLTPDTDRRDAASPEEARKSASR